MKFSSTLARLLWRGGFAASVTALALVACGGGTRVEDYHPERIIAFGDEYSAFAPPVASPPASQASVAARKYGVNYEIAASGTNVAYTDCRSNALWIQQVAAAFNLVFDACKGAATTATGVTYAQPAASSGAIQPQIATFQATAAKGFNDKDLVTIMVGQNDVLELYNQFPATGADALLEQARQRAKTVALQANAVATSGPAVLVMRIPNVDLSPFGQAQSADGRSLLRKLTEAFNVSLQLNLINDGHLIGLVYGDAEINNMHDFAAAYGLGNVTAAWCAQAFGTGGALVTDATPLQNCTLSTPSAAASAAGAASSSGSFLYAGALMLGPTAQSRLGNLAADRALNNPF
jgi:lysophospholipase L1-like esterase